MQLSVFSKCHVDVIVDLSYFKWNQEPNHRRLPRGRDATDSTCCGRSAKLAFNGQEYAYMYKLTINIWNCEFP